LPVRCLKRRIFFADRRSDTQGFSAGAGKLTLLPDRSQFGSELCYKASRRGKVAFERLSHLLVRKLGLVCQAYATRVGCGVQNPNPQPPSDSASRLEVRVLVVVVVS
jgi:hypothetical protein